MLLSSTTAAGSSSDSLLVLTLAGCLLDFVRASACLLLAGCLLDFVRALACLLPKATGPLFMLIFITHDSIVTMSIF
jgi:hypothetical protein